MSLDHGWKRRRLVRLYIWSTVPIATPGGLATRGCKHEVLY